MDSSSFVDFDLRILDVTLGQKQLANEGYTWNAYREGRKASGVTCVILGAAMMIFNDGRKEKLEAGDVAFIPASAAYRFCVPMGAEACLHYTINFVLGGELPEWLPSTSAFITKPTDVERQQRNFEECVNLWNAKTPGYKMQVISRLYQILYDMLIMGLKQRADPRALVQMAPLKQYIEEHYAEPIDLKTLADVCNLSLTHFRRLFKSVYNASPISYLQAVRLEKAKDLLLANDYKLEYIAEMTGFQNASYFIRFFRKHTGMTPQKYRNMY